MIRDLTMCVIVKSRTLNPGCEFRQTRNKTATVFASSSPFSSVNCHTNYILAPSLSFVPCFWNVPQWGERGRVHNVEIGALGIPTKSMHVCARASLGDPSSTVLRDTSGSS